ncbi:tetratricopeptide repeat protein [Dyadobacter sandarakinus]|uniref:histidine kinase n=1 Tax=Dyadobacter sandarakinus TaxID=2747268 RepID=A0ABX7I5B1_9BACT|nr:tetratricopeptide repeat protein [Dyadobacter sandarakinus]QRR01286.1 tetratricopeptide repeat protein [Dyadobacter sandarakinus]
MKHLSIALFLLFSQLAAPAQDRKLDSINRLITTVKSDTAKVNRLLDKIGILSTSNLDSALALSLSTIQFSRKISYTAGEGRARMLSANYYSYKGDFEAAKNNLQLSEKIFSDQENQQQLLKVYNAYGTMYGMQSKYDSSLSFLKKALSIAEAEKQGNMLSTIYMNIGISYQMLSDQPQALAYQQKALRIAEAEKDVTQQAYCLVNIANTLRNIGDVKRAEQSFGKAVSLARQADIKNVELYAYTNLAALFTDQKTEQKAYDYAMKAAALARQMGDTGIEATSLSRAATNLARQKKYVDAEKLARQAIGIADRSQQPLNIHQTYSAMGVILRMQEKYAAAIPYFEQSFEALKDADIYDAQTGEMYAELALCYEKSGNYRRALAAQKVAASIADSVRGKENVRKTTELSMTYAFEKQQQAQQVEQERKNTLAKTQMATLSTGIILMFALASMSFYAYRTKQKANNLLEVQKTALQETLEKLRTTQTQLIHAEKMASLGELTAGIAHEIQNPLNFVNNFSEVSMELAEEMQQELESGSVDEARAIATDIRDNLQRIMQHGKRADGIVKGMLEHSRSSTGTAQPTDIPALIEEYLKLALHAFRAREQDFQPEIHIGQDHNTGLVNAFPQDLGRVLLNLLNNAFYAVNQKQKAGPDGYQPVISIHTRRDEKFVEISVQDNGTGISGQSVQKIFQPFYTTKPTGQGTGLGLSISYDIITKGHGGTLEVSSMPGEGSTFVIRLPA